MLHYQRLDGLTSQGGNEESCYLIELEYLDLNGHPLDGLTRLIQIDAIPNAQDFIWYDKRY